MTDFADSVLSHDPEVEGPVRGSSLAVLINNYQSVRLERLRAQEQLEKFGALESDLKGQLAQRLRDELGDVLHLATADAGY